MFKLLKFQIFKVFAFYVQKISILKQKKKKKEVIMQRYLQTNKQTNTKISIKQYLCNPYNTFKRSSMLLMTYCHNKRANRANHYPDVAFCITPTVCLPQLRKMKHLYIEEAVLQCSEQAGAS